MDYKAIINLMKEMNIWKGEVSTIKDAIVSMEKEVEIINSKSSGIFMSTLNHLAEIKKGDSIGEIINPLTGEMEEKVISPCDGMLFTLREYPVVYEGSLIARVLGGVKWRKKYYLH